MRDYSEVIEDDLNTMKNLGMEGKMDDINAELQKRLAGHVEENTGDDQLLGEAQKLKAGEFWIVWKMEEIIFDSSFTILKVEQEIL